MIIKGDKKTNEIQNNRGKIISNFAFLETIISLFITNYYFGKTNTQFIEEVMDDEFFSFELKRRLFTKIIKHHFKEKIDKFPNKEFRRMQEIRNIIAHATITAVTNSNSPGDVSDICFSHGGTRHTAETLINEYESLRLIVQKAISELPTIHLE